MIIANIVSKSKMDLGPEFNIVKSVDDITNDLPTLIVGFKVVKEMFGELDMMDRKVDGYHWTFAKNEKRDYFNQDIEHFMDYAFQHSVDNTSYLYVDPLTMSLTSIKKIINKIYSIKDLYSFNYQDKMVYIYGEGIIFGIDLKVLRFIDVDIVKFKGKVNSISKVFLEGNEILIEYKNYMERLDDQAKYIPFLYSISNDE